MVRIPDYIKQEIKRGSQIAFGDAQLILFGSRVDDSKKGGDIDLAIDADMSIDEFRKAKVKFFKYLILKDIDFPIDFIHYQRANKLLKDEISKGIKL